MLILRSLVDETISEFTRQTDQLGTIAQQRFAALNEGGDEIRVKLDAQEVEALAAITAVRPRWMWNWRRCAARSISKRPKA